MIDSQVIKHREAQARYREKNPELCNERTRTWEHNNQDYKKSYKKEYYLKNKEKCIEKSKRWALKNKAKRRIINLRAKYNLTLEQYESMLSLQNGKCAICKNPMLKPNIDHCHKTNIIRGLLCRECNYMLGFADDNIVTLKNAIEYLK